jgi:hypothetical protein
MRRGSIRNGLASLPTFLLAVAVQASGGSETLKINLSLQPDHLTVAVRNTSGSARQIETRVTLHLSTPSNEAGPTRRFWASVEARSRPRIKGRPIPLFVPPRNSAAFQVAMSPLEWYEGLSPEGSRVPARVPAGWYELTASLDAGASNRILVVVDHSGQIAAGK